MDVKDKKILQELELNSRKGFSDIAKSVGLSKQVVAYRVSQLVKNNVINQFVAIVDTQKLGFTFYHVFFQLKNVFSDKEQEIINYLKGLKHVAWLVSCVGRWSLIASFLVKDAFDFNKSLESFYDVYSDFIEEKEILIVVDGYHCRKKYLLDDKDFKKESYFGKRDEVDLFSQEIAVLKCLKQDSQMSLIEIAKKTRLSFETVKSYIKKLQEKNVIQAFTIKINPFSYGFEWYSVLVEFQKSNQELRNKFINQLHADDFVVFIASVVGNFNLAVDFHVKNAVQLKNIMSDLQASSKNIIKSYEFVLINKEYKCEFIPEL